jgi:hypothetical protein
MLSQVFQIRINVKLFQNKQSYSFFLSFARSVFNAFEYKKSGFEYVREI